jgi:hypothetical protein
MRYYQLTATDGGPLPPHPWLHVGAIIRVERSNCKKPGAQWNPETSNWVMPIWTPCDDPTGGAA